MELCLSDPIVTGTVPLQESHLLVGRGRLDHSDCSEVTHLQQVRCPFRHFALVVTWKFSLPGNMVAIILILSLKVCAFKERMNLSTSVQVASVHPFERLGFRSHPCQYIEALLYLVDGLFGFQNHGYQNLQYVAGR